MVGGRGGIVERIDCILEDCFILQFEIHGDVDDFGCVGGAEIAGEPCGGRDVVLGELRQRGRHSNGREREKGRQAKLWNDHGFS